jgi:N-acetyl-anhydromuramyl-L-alanine amidase AmpD
VRSITKHLVHGGSAVNKPSLIIIHAMAENIKDGDKTYSAHEFLQWYGLSAHALCTPDGVIIRCRDDDEIAWHARGHNTDSLGIEFLVRGEHDYASFLKAIEYPYLSPNQYSAGVEQVKIWMDKYGITDVRRHSDVSPGRKVDPGNGFYWDKLRKDLGL